MAYNPPLDDIRFCLFHVLDAPSVWAGCSALSQLDEATAASVLEGAARFARETLAPTNVEGDRVGAQWSPTGVTVPESFQKAYAQFCESGWPALACSPEWGGQGLPFSVNTAAYEMWVSANHAWTMYPGLAHGAYACIEAYASLDIKAQYLPKLVNGEWLATMCLTEPQAGTDLGILRTQAQPQANGSFTITGNKIFISGGDHDMSPNIVHLVLARLPDAPAGSKGISLFLVPKVLMNGERNGVQCQGIEHKLGIHGSATCHMQFESAQGWLIGEPHSGLRAMFVMMNAARLHVGVQGLAHMESAWQASLDYALSRVQGGRSIAEHPVVQRLLLTQKAWLEGGRMLALWTALSLDRADFADDEPTRSRARVRCALLTPIVKALLTERGFENASLALQVFGGYGYTRDMGIEQTLRDARIAMIYEGTNEVQAIDLITRKVLPDGGETLRGVLEALGTADAAPDANARFIALTSQIAALAKLDAELPQRVAVDFLHAVSLLLVAALWKHAANRAVGTPFEVEKKATASFYFENLLPQIESRIITMTYALSPRKPWSDAL
jgi:alkylation response protein AidB-like acyl-CoA dehydrogenase